MEFDGGKIMKITLVQMLDARERRAQRQRELLKAYPGHTLISFTMNIAGPVKNSPLIREGFLLGKDLLLGQLSARGFSVLFSEEIDEATGSEALFVLDGASADVKKMTVFLEDHTIAGRLFDMDVLSLDGEKIDRCSLGFSPRKCLLCGKEAALCARSRAHSLSLLCKETEWILLKAVRESRCRRIARLACQALLYEVAVTPKPGLVDRENSGSHQDMDFFTFQASASALWPYFFESAGIGMDTKTLPPDQTFSHLRISGQLAEGRMYEATGGVNTHKGAIFSLGVLCGALGRLERSSWKESEQVLSECAALTRGITERDFAGLTPETANTAGQKLYLSFGITGVRGQAEKGFPLVLDGLSVLERALASGRSINDAGCIAFLSMLSQNEDTNLIRRGGYALQKRLANDLSYSLKKDGFPDMESIRRMDQSFIEQNLSPGGTADLLAMVFMLHFLKENENGRLWYTNDRGV